MGHNSGLSPEAARAEMEQMLERHMARIDEFCTKSEKAEIDDREAAEAAVDFVRMAKRLAGQIDADLKDVLQPYQDAAGAARAAAQKQLDRLESAETHVRNLLDQYQAAAKKLADEAAAEQAAAEEELKRKAGIKPEETAPAPTPSPKKKAPVLRTNTGGRMSQQARWRAVVEDVTKVPEFVLNSPKVKEAIEAVSRDFMKNGMDVDGVRREDFTTNSIT